MVALTPVIARNIAPFIAMLYHGINHLIKYYGFFVRMVVLALVVLYANANFEAYHAGGNSTLWVLAKTALWVVGLAMADNIFNILARHDIKKKAVACAVNLAVWIVVCFAMVFIYWEAIPDIENAHLIWGFALFAAMVWVGEVKEWFADIFSSRKALH